MTETATGSDMDIGLGLAFAVVAVVGAIGMLVAYNDQVDDITELAVEAAVERDYDIAVEVREKFAEVGDREEEILSDLDEMSNEDVLQVREVLVSLQQTAQYAVRNAEIATNLALNEESEHTTIQSDSTND